MPDQSELAPEYRAAVVAGIRALADLIESNTDLPVPASVHAQYSVIGNVTPDDLALFQRVADKFGVEVQVEKTSATVRKRVTQGGFANNLPWFTVDYVLHGFRTSESEGGAGDE